jgi:hypothetical protein
MRFPPTKSLVQDRPEPPACAALVGCGQSLLVTSVRIGTQSFWAAHARNADHREYAKYRVTLGLADAKADGPTAAPRPPSQMG